MWVLFDILKYSLSSAIWGLLIAFICMALFVFLIKGWYKDATFSPVSYLIGGVLFLLLSFQCVFIVGSIKILDTTDYYETEITNLINSICDATDEVPIEKSEEITKEIIDKYPILQYYIGDIEYSGFTARQLPHAIAEELRSFMHWYIFRRILWCLGFVIVGAICVIRSMSMHKKYVSSNLRRSVNSDDF
jgi:hypothetical protein